MRFLCSTAVLLLAMLPGCNTGNAHLGLLGKPAPAISIGGANPLDRMRGHVVVLNFWASWCPPCLQEFPSLATLQRQMPEVKVLAVSFDTDRGAYTQFLARHPLALQTALDTTGRANGAFGTTRPPETWIIDPQGTVRRRFIGAQDWTSPEIMNYLKALETRR